MKIFLNFFSNNAINKDLHLLQDLAYNLKLPLYTAAIPKELFSKMKMMGKREEDFSSIYQLFKNKKDKMPHLQFEINKKSIRWFKRRVCEWNKKTFFEIMDTGTSYCNIN